MKKKLINLLIMLVAIISFASISISTSAFGQDKYSVSGEINFLEAKGQFICHLKTFEELDNRLVPAQSERRLILNPSQQQLQTKKITFTFTDVQKGEYCIRCVQDLNMNGKQNYLPDVGLPTDPIAYSGPLVFGYPMWEDVSFKVDKNISGIEIKY